MCAYNIYIYDVGIWLIVYVGSKYISSYVLYFEGWKVSSFLIPLDEKQPVTRFKLRSF